LPPNNAEVAAEVDADFCAPGKGWCGGDACFGEVELTLAKPFPPGAQWQVEVTLALGEHSVQAVIADEAQEHLLLGTYTQPGHTHTHKNTHTQTLTREGWTRTCCRV